MKSEPLRRLGRRQGSWWNPRDLIGLTVNFIGLDFSLTRIKQHRQFIK